MQPASKGGCGTRGPRVTWPRALLSPLLTWNSLGSRSFYLALYKQMSFLEKRGCPRTALEYCKLILR